MKLLLVAATQAEIQQTLDFLPIMKEKTTDWEVNVLISGVGLMATTFSLTRTLARTHYDFVLQAGIGGLYQADEKAGIIALGDLVIIQSESLGDLGAEDHERYISIFDLGFLAENEVPFTSGMLVNPLNNIPFSPKLPLINSVTVHTVSGSTATIQKRYGQLQMAAESMEGAALHYVCLQLQVPFLQLRAISNYVTPRDRGSWQIGKAIKKLNEQLISWIGELK